VGVLLLARIFSESRMQPAAPAGEGILFADQVGDASDLYVVQPDGSGLTQLTTTGHVGSGSWSPDGTRIIFPRFDESTQTSDLFVMDPDGSHVHRLTDTPDVSEARPRWSPDGFRIAFEATPAQGPSGVYVMSADGSDVERLTTETLKAGRPDWSPDGSRLVFDAMSAHPNINDVVAQLSQIWVMDADGSDAHALTSGRSSNHSPRWSPAGDTIVFTHDRDIYVMNVDSTGMTNLTPTSETDFYDRDPAWSSDGRRIVFASTRNHGDAESLFTMNPDGTDVQPVIDRAIGFCCPEPDWRGPAASVTTPSSEPEPSPTPSPSSAEDIGLGFGVCNVSSLDGHFLSPDETSTVFVATKVGDTEDCPQPDEAFNVVALDPDGDGLADSSFGPIECTLDCRAFAAPDLDGDGTDELLIVQDGGAVVGLRLYDVSMSGDQPQIVPVDVADPGDPFGGFDPGEQASLLLGGDAFELYTLRCGDDPAGSGLIATSAESLPHDSSDAEWHAHETTFVIENGNLAVVDTRDYTEPVTDDPSGPSFQSGKTLCGARLGPIPPIPGG
jgi:dipeptidyl aminopeptidase/acylaminoacyl peptidase